MAIRVGIDLGTTNTVVRCYDEESGRLFYLPLGSNKSELSMPSIVYLDEREHPIVGIMAEKRMKIQPQRAIRSAKTHIGTDHTYPEPGQTFKTTLYSKDVAEIILRDVKDRLVQKGYCTQDEKVKAIITVPAYFTILQKTETMEVGERAGFSVEVTSEPRAAAASYIRNVAGDYDHLFVVDFGGGTLDLTYLINENQGRGLSAADYKAVAIGGDRHLGGDDIDDCVLTMLKKIIQDDYGIDLTSAETAGIDPIVFKRDVEANLRDEAIRIKKELSQFSSIEDAENPHAAVQADLPLPELGSGCELYALITVKQFNECCQGIYERVEARIAEVFNENPEYKIEDVQNVLLVGGSCYIPMIQHLVAEIFQTKPMIYNPMEAVAHGAGELVYQDLLPQEERIGIKDHTPHDMGIKVEENGKKEISILLPRNTPLPATYSRKFKTNKPYGKVINVDVYERTAESSRNDLSLENCSFIRRLTITEGFTYDSDGIAKIEVTFTLVEGGALTVEVKDILTDKKLDIADDREYPGQMPEDENEAEPMDVILLLDTSGSMDSAAVGNSGPTCLDEAKKAVARLANEFLDMNVHRVGFYEFADSDLEPQKMCLTNDASGLVRQVNSLCSHWNTYVAKAISKAAADLANSSANGRMPVIIVLTDGGFHDPLEAARNAENAKKNGIRIISIGAGDMVDNAQLNRIASSPEDVYMISNMTALGDTFRTIVNTLRNM